MNIDKIKIDFKNKFNLFYWNKLPYVIFIITLLVYPVFCIVSWLRIFVKKVLFIKPSVVWGPTPIINIKENSKLLNQIGYKSKTVVYTTYHITQDFDKVFKKYLSNQRTAIWLPHVVFLWTLLKFDIYHYFYDFGFWSGMNVFKKAKWLELPLLRLAGKRIIASAYGADVRVKHLNQMWQPTNACDACPEIGKNCICDLGSANVNTKYYREWANVCLAMGDMYDYVFGSVVDFNYWPIDTDKIKYVGVQEHSGPIKVVHSPNHRHFKGTKYIQESVEELKKKGYNLELILVEGIPNDVAKQKYAEADIVFAQCLYGWMGYTEIEAMAAGKPVMTFIRNMEKYLGHTHGCPIVNASPTALTEKLEELVSDFKLRKNLGEAGRAYIEKEWSFHALAPKFDKLHKDIWKKNGLLRVIINKIIDFRNGDTGYRVSRNLKSEKLGEWLVYSNPFLNLERINHGCYGQPPFNEKGLLRFFYNGQYVEQPGTISLTALNAFHCLLVLPKSEEYKKMFFVHADWLKDNLEIDDKGIGRWWYMFEAPSRDNMGKKWVSCFSQSLGISILLRAYQLSGDEVYLAKVRSAIKLYTVDLEDSGVLWKDESGVYLEEYPENPPAHVLNGFMTGLFGLYEYKMVTGEDWADKLFNDCLETLIKIIPEYETPTGLKYDLKNTFEVNADYYYFIVQQLYAMHKITDREEFISWAKAWKKKMYRLKRKNFLSGSLPI